MEVIEVGIDYGYIRHAAERHTVAGFILNAAMEP